ncbi:MAG: invasion associated locus B family protein [Alphaproteobacteria bacterium]
MRRPLVLAGVLLALWPLLAAPGLAQSERHLGTYESWEAFARPQDGSSICYMASTPSTQEGSYAKRGDAYVMVLHRPAAKKIGIVSVTAGYNFKDGSPVEVAIGGAKFPLYTHKDTPDTAWAYDDKAVLDAMIKGATMVVRGTSGRGTPTTDTYSLKGVSRAYREISKACSVP